MNKMAKVQNDKMIRLIQIRSFEYVFCGMDRPTFDMWLAILKQRVMEKIRLCYYFLLFKAILVLLCCPVLRTDSGSSHLVIQELWVQVYLSYVNVSVGKALTPSCLLICLPLLECVGVSMCNRVNVGLI